MIYPKIEMALFLKREKKKILIFRRKRNSALKISEMENTPVVLIFQKFVRRTSRYRVIEIELKM